MPHTVLVSPMTHPHRLPTALGRSAPQGATLAARRSRFRGVPGWRCGAPLCAAAWRLLALSRLPALAATKVTIAVISLADDARYDARRVERAYPGPPDRPGAGWGATGCGRFGLRARCRGPCAGRCAMWCCPMRRRLPKALAALKAAKVQHVIADLPLAEMRQLVQAAPGGAGRRHGVQRRARRRQPARRRLRRCLVAHLPQPPDDERCAGAVPGRAQLAQGAGA